MVALSNLWEKEKFKKKKTLQDIQMEPLAYKETRTNLQPNRECCEMFTVQEKH